MMPLLAGENSGQRVSPYDQRVLVYVEAVAGTFLTTEKAAGQLMTANDGG